MTITRRALVRKVRPSKVEIVNPEITWEKGFMVLRKSNVRPTQHNYEIAITLDEFRQMLRAFTGSESAAR